MRRSRRRVAWAAATLVLLALVGVFVRPVRVRIEAAATLADALGLPVVRPFAATVERERVTIGGVRGDLYDPGPSAPAVVLVPGATPAGIDDRRVIQLAQALAGSDRAVFVPVLELYHEELVRADVDRVAAAAAALAEQRPPDVMLVGISFGGSLCLLAAADAQLEQRVARVATFGAYFDLVGVAQAATTGTSLVGDQRVPWHADPRAEGVVRRHLIGLLPDGQRRGVRDALAGRRDPTSLPADGRAVYQLLANEDPAATYPLARGLPARIQARIDAVSPSSVAEQLEVPIVAMHTSDDRAVPAGELLRLGAALPDAQLIWVDSFDHVDLRLGSPASWMRGLDDLWNVWRFATVVLDTQEGWWP